MPLATRNLAVAQRRDKEMFQFVRGGGWDRPRASFKSEDYELLKQKNPKIISTYSTCQLDPTFYE